MLDFYIKKVSKYHLVTFNYKIKCGVQIFIVYLDGRYMCTCTEKDIETAMECYFHYTMAWGTKK